ncbi:autotransporter outer membrane beta-barrel domain-containing protein [Stenotrophomonas sp. HMWF023]|uniref:autotransporter outer membrane beta-barrel domain-containing protein n=1 Tax=Stenotrophomonas sp. HMWF023 TaxID=2056859 RepID=UPI000D3D9010|nr:autotransporter outer membrane beta-barrel domain-containing protein [Stenotrophomonas sp. HMWF023]PTS81170.1 autotransporter outer membrane beta-barrel domain-containing protein [Stenotrophomonas sp. HMWF023]
MQSPHPPRHGLSLALAVALAAPHLATAQQVIADGDAQVPAAGDYATVDPVSPGDRSGYVFYAINGGSIVPGGQVNLRSEGLRAAAARVEGLGSRIELSGGSINTTGYGAAGVSITTAGAAVLQGTRIQTHGVASSGIELAGGTLGASNVHITTQGGLSHGVSLRGGNAELRDSLLAVNGSNSDGIHVGGGTLLAERVQIDQNTDGSAVRIAAGTASAVTLRNVQINGSAAGSNGVVAGAGSNVLLEDVDITLAHELSGEALSIGGEVVMRGGRIHAAGDGASVVSITRGGKGTLDGVDIQGRRGMLLWDNATLDMRNSTLTSANIGININQSNSTATIVGSRITADTGEGILLIGDSTLSLVGSTVTSHGTLSPAVSLFRGQAALEDSMLRTTGVNGHGLYADGSTVGSPVAHATRVDILTTGAGAVGAIARLSGSSHLADSVVRTTGINAHGVLSGGRGAMTLRNTHVRTEGEGAWAAVINDNGRLQIDGGSLVSAEHGGVWLRSSRDAGLTLGNGALLSGGNGTALSLDAAVSGRFDVRLENGAQMQGDIVITREDLENGRVPQSQVQVSLAGGSHWWGSSDLVEHLELGGGSQWTLRGDARVAALTVRDSTVALSDGRSAVGNILTVDGDLHSDGGTLLFHGALAGDDTVIDRLHVRGDTSGDASLRVQNVGGVGAPTEDGIQLIQVDGASLARYALAGRAVGGSYEYFLFQGGIADPNDGQWYLRSQWFDRCQDDPTSPGCVTDPDPTPGPDPEEGGDDGTPITPPGRVLRPEAGAYLANQAAAVGMFQHRLHDRSGAPGLAEGRGAWARVGRQQADFQAVGGQLAVNGTTSLLQVGSDVWQRGGATVGLTLGSGRADNTVVSTLTGYTAKGRVRGTAIGAYATWLQRPGHVEGAYLDASVQRGRFDNRVDGVDLPREQYDAHVLNTSVEGGYTFNVWQGPNAALYVQPQLQLSHVDYRADRHVERNGTRVDGADVDGLSGRMGVRVFGHDTRAGNVVQPYMAVNWLRGMRASTLDFNGETLGADVPRDRYEVQAGAELKLGQRWSAWGGMSVQRGDHDYRNVGGRVGLRVVW